MRASIHNPVEFGELSISLVIYLKTAEYAQRVTRTRAEGFRQALVTTKKVATGATKNSIRYQFSSTPFLIRGTVYGSAGVRYVISGRKPGSKLPPKGSLIPWMRARGIASASSDGSEEESVEFLIRRKIARDGIPPTDLTAFALKFSIPDQQVRSRLRLLLGEDAQDFMLASAALIWTKGRTINL